MASAERQERPDRDGSCFSRAARAIRRALSRICGDTSPSVPTLDPSSRDHAQSGGDYEKLNAQLSAHYSARSRRPKTEFGSLTVRRPYKQGCESDFKRRIHLGSTRYESLTLRRDTPRRDSYDSSYEKSLDVTPIYSFFKSKRAPITNRVIQDSTDTEGSKEQEEFKMMSVGAESESGDVSDALVTVEAVVMAENYSATNAQQTRPDLQMSSHPGSTKRDSSCLSRSHSVPSLSQISSAKNKTLTRSQSLPDLLIKSSSEEFELSWRSQGGVSPEIHVYGGPTESDTSEDSIIIPPPSPIIGSVEPLRGSSLHPSFINYSIGMSRHIQYDTREIKLHSTAGPSNLQLSSSDDDDSDSAYFYGKRARMDWRRGYDEDTTSVFRPAFYLHGGYFPSTPSQAQGQNLLIPNRKDTDDGGLSFDNSISPFTMRYCSESTAPTVWGPPCPQDSLVVPQDSTVCTEGSRAQDDDVLIEMETSDTALDLSVTNNQSTHSDLQLSSDPGWTERDSNCLSRSHSVPSLSQTTSPENKTFTPSQSLPDLLLKSSFEEFTPDSTLHSLEPLCLSMSGPMQDDTREMELMPPSAGDVPYSLELSSRDLAEFYEESARMGRMTWDALPLSRIRRPEGYVPTIPSLAQDQALHLPDRKDTDDGGPSFDNSSSGFSIQTCSLSTEELLQCRGRRPAYKRSTVCTQGSSAQDPLEILAYMDPMSGSMQNDTREMEPHSAAGPSIIQLSSGDDNYSNSAEPYGKRTRMGWMGEYDEYTTSLLSNLCRGGGYVPTTLQAQGEALHLPNRKDTDYGGLSFDNSSSPFTMQYCSLSTAATVWGPPCPQDSPVVPQDSTVCTEGSRAQDDDVLIEMETSDTALDLSVTNNQSTHSHLQLPSSDPGWTERDSNCLSRSHSVPSLSQTTSPENKTFTPSQSLPDMLLKSSFEEFTPDISVDEDDETYWFQCSCPGLYQCSVTGLVFHMEGEGDVVYRTVPWDRRLLAQHHKQPAGPLFDIKCLQQSVCQLHLPHCEIRSTGGCEFLSVAHVNDEGIEFIVPQKITETHVIINITGFSGFGNVKDEDSPPDPVRALVLLFYRPPADPDPESLLSVLLLPVNIVLRDVLRTRKKLVGDEIYIETSSHCKLCPNQDYTLSTCPEDDSVLVQPTEAEFDCDNYDNYFPSFQVILEKLMKHIKLFLRETKSSKSVWERRVCLSSTAVKRSCGPSALNLPPNDRLLDIRSSFIDGISGPVLKSLLDKLLEKTVLTDSERESADEIQNHRDKARFVVDTVRKKGEAASSEMIQFLCEVDPFLCEHLGLI